MNIKRKIVILVFLLVPLQLLANDLLYMIVPVLASLHSQDDAGKLKKTGQTISYDMSGDEVEDGSFRDDGFYQKGIEARYSRDDALEIVTDQITGLMWQDDVDAATVTKQWVTQTNYDAGNYDDTSGDTADTYCADLVVGTYDN